MKKGFIIIGSIAILLTVAILVLAFVDFNRIGKDHVYYQVDTPSSVEENKLDSGEIIKRFTYAGEAYHENGETIMIEFSAPKELRESAYLKIYLNKNNEATSYDEVEKSDLPDKITF